MSQFRNDIITGAARVVYGSGSFFSAADSTIKLPFRPETFEVRLDGHAQPSLRFKDIVPVVSVTPDGRMDSTIASILFPFRSAQRGTRLFNNTAVPLYFHCQTDTAGNSPLYTMLNAAVQKSPEILFSPVKTLVGAVDFVCLRTNDGSGIMTPQTAASTMALAATTGGVFVDSTFNASQIMTQPYTATWGSVTGFASIDTFEDEGFVFRQEVSVKPIVMQAARTVNFIVESVKTSVSFRPATPTAAQMFTSLPIQGTSSSAGIANMVPGSQFGNGADLTITGADGLPYLILRNAVISEGGYEFGSLAYRNDMITMTSQPTYTSGVPSPAFQMPQWGWTTWA